MRQKIVLTHEFVEFIPDDLKERTIYVSIRFATATHKCFCGCGKEVVTPLSPTDWKLIFDGKTISLDPSIGNWNFACRSHYWIRRNTVEWAPQWSQEQINAGRVHDSLAKERYFDNTKTPTVHGTGASVGGPAEVRPTESVWRTFKKWLFG